MEEHSSYYLDQSDIRWQDNEPPSQTTISQPDEVPLVSSMLETNTYQTANSLFPPEPFSNHREVSLLDTPYTSFRLHEPLGLWMGASESSLYGNCYNPMWEQSPLSSLLVGNVFPEAPLPLQQSSLSNEYGGAPSILPDMGYPHLSSEFQQVHYPYGTLMEYVQSTEHMPRTSCDNHSSGIDNTTSLETITTHTARNEETPVAQAESGEKPYSYLLYRALRSADRHKLTLQEIYCWFEENTNKANGPNSTGWKSTIRYNLSVNVVCKPLVFFPPNSTNSSEGVCLVYRVIPGQVKNQLLDTHRGGSSQGYTPHKTSASLWVKKIPQSPELFTTTSTQGKERHQQTHLQSPRKAITW
jgi:hypothetical protein